MGSRKRKPFEGEERNTIKNLLRRRKAINIHIGILEKKIKQLHEEERRIILTLHRVCSHPKWKHNTETIPLYECVRCGCVVSEYYTGDQYRHIKEHGRLKR